MNVIDILNEHTVLVASAHPDDKLTHGHLLNERAKKTNPDTSTHEYVASWGEATTVNNYAASDPNFIIDGRRRQESLAMGVHFKLDTILHDHYPDGGLTEVSDVLIEAVLERALAVGATALVSTAGLTDHPDHVAMGRATTAAGERLAKIQGHTLVLQLYARESYVPVGEEFCVATVTPESTRYALSGATHNGSHHELFSADTALKKPEGWSLTPDGYFFASDLTIQELEQYPIWDTAAYTIQRKLGALALFVDNPPHPST
ncbi:MAG TPA: PIG-L family deacetylase [Patescibacteria group bacterium]|jgi:hypothetical protein|nr:PIG-L family deacetylase [Patescibacteria group bacterium]